VNRVDQYVHALIDLTRQRLHSNTPPATVTNAGTQYTCISGTLSNPSGSSPATDCIWRAGPITFTIAGVNLDQQTVLSLAPQAQGATVPSG
jgi:hypothetical protein